MPAQPHESRRPTFWEHSDMTDYMTRSRLDDALQTLAEVEHYCSEFPPDLVDRVDTMIARLRGTRASL